MKNSLRYYLIASSLILTGCEVDQQSTNIVSERPFGTIFDAPEVWGVQSVQPPMVQKESKITNLPANFSPKESITNATTEKPGASLDKNDLLYGFYNSGIVGEPADFDNFFTESDSQAPQPLGTIFDTSSVKPQNFDNFFNNNDEAPVMNNDLFSSSSGSDFDFELDQEKQKKINKIKEATIATQKNSVIADQIRNKDIDEQLALDLSSLEKSLPISKKSLVKEMSNELRHKTRLLDAETALKIAELKMLSSVRSNNIISRVEDMALDATSAARKESIKKILSVEPDNYYQLKQQGKQLEAAYQVDVATIKLKFQNKIDYLKSDVKLLREANKKIIDNRIAELEAQRIADALIIEIREKEKNQKIVKQSYPKLDDKILKYSNTFEKRLVEKENLILDRLNTEYSSAKLARKSARELENRQYLAKINQQIEQEQISYENKSGNKLYAKRDLKVESIANNLKSTIKRTKSHGIKALADLKAKSARTHQVQKNKLKGPYNKKEQALNQKYQQDKSKILSRFRTEEYAVVAKIKKETDNVNREIDARVKAEIQTLLASFEVLKQEEIEKAKKINVEKPKESPGFFESLF